MRLRVLLALLVIPGISLGATGQKVGTVANPSVGGNASESVVTATGGTTARKLKDRFSETVNVKDFGAKGDGTTDDTAAIQAAINAGAGAKVVFAPAGRYKVGTLTLPSKTRILGASRWGSGDIAWGQYGTGATVFLSAAGDDVFQITGPGTSNVGDFRFGIEIGHIQIQGAGSSGNSGNGIRIDAPSAGGPAYLWFHDLAIHDCGGSGVSVAAGTMLWHSDFDRVTIDNCGGHLFDLTASNTLTLRNCYALRVPTSGKAGYRIRGNPVMISCNGVNTVTGGSTHWGIFGESTTDSTGGTDASDTYSYPTLINCNAEDAADTALYFKRGAPALIGGSIQAKSGATTRAIYIGGSASSGHGSISDSVQFNLKSGSAWSHGVPVETANIQPPPYSGTQFTQFWTGAALSTYPRIYVGAAGLAAGNVGFGGIQIGSTGHLFAYNLNAATASWTPGTIAANACAETTFAVTDAYFGAFAWAAWQTGALPAGVTISAAVNSAGNVKVSMCNQTASPVTINGGSAGTVRAGFMGVGL